MFGLITSLAGLPLINPISLGAGAAFGGKTIKDESDARLKRRQAAAKAAAQRHVDDFFLACGKEAKDLSRQVQRTLRDHVNERAEDLAARITESSKVARQPAVTAAAEREQRRQTLTAQLNALVQLHARAAVLADQRAVAAPAHRRAWNCRRDRAWMSRPGLADVAWHMLTSAAELYRDSPRAAQWLVGCLERLAEPVRIAVTGAPGVGRSTLVNALVGELVAPVGVAAPTWYRDGAEPEVVVYQPDAPPYPVAVARRDRQLHADLRQWSAEQVDRVLVDWPARGLRDMVLVDTPGGTDADWLAGHVDAVVHATREPSPADTALLRSGGDATIIAMTRADELGAGRIDALTSAKQIARRRRSDIAVNAVCHNVIAVAGLLAATGRTLRDDEFAALRALSGIPRPELDLFLLSADRFAGGDLPIRMPADTRVALLDRFGVFGIRLCATLIRRGADSQATLAAQLAQRSGLSELRESIGRYFLDRTDALRGRSALLGLAMVLRTEPRPQARQLAADAERAVASTHDFAELRLLAALQAGRLTFPNDLAATAERLAGGNGTGIADRLAIDGDATEPEIRNAVYDELGRWRAQAESPLLGAAERAAARTVVRTCEGILADRTTTAYR